MALPNLVRAFYSPALYYDEAHRNEGLGFGYMAALSLLLVVVYYIAVVTSNINSQLTSPDVIDQVKKLPAITFTDGKLSTDAPNPYIIPIGKGHDTAYIVINTAYHPASLDGLSNYLRDNHVVALITDTRIITRKDAGELDIRDMSTMRKPMTITHDNWHTFAEQIPLWCSIGLFGLIPFFVFLAMLLGNFILTFFNAIAVAILTWLFRAHVVFSGSMRVAAAIRWTVNTITLVGAYVLHHNSWLVGWGVWFIYLIAASWSARHVRNG